MSQLAQGDYGAKLDALKANLGKAIQGKSECIDLLTIAVIANGSVLMEDVPGVGKTTLAKALAQSIDAEMSRIQFTPDLLPADILGASIYNPSDGTFHFRRGPIFCNVLLADEINRASPRTQSALLEAMNEWQTTIEGQRYLLPEPFLVIATQNPIEFHGTYPLPEAQLDRFLMEINLGYPSPDVEVSILRANALSHPMDSLTAVLDRGDVVAMQRAARAVTVSEPVSRYIVNLVNATREDARLRAGVSPRGSLMLFRAAQAAAFCAGRDYALPDDVQRLARNVLAHRIMLTSKAKYGGNGKAEVVSDILATVKVPT
ncbi:MAG TPA: MoxR family ATPase [Candidatus Hydrogenedentes bacterium]|nr:MoxR family ATPase [Candidatus Hydrogenedentota bacterium]